MILKIDFRSKSVNIRRRMVLYVSNESYRYCPHCYILSSTKDGIVEDREFIRIVCTLCTLEYDVIGCSIGFKFKKSTLKLYLSNKLIIVGATNGGKITTRL